MKSIAAALLVLVSVLTINFANGASSPDRPAGVEERDWIAVTDKMGFVVTTPHTFPLAPLDKQPLLLTPPAEPLPGPASSDSMTLMRSEGLQCPKNSPKDRGTDCAGLTIRWSKK